MASLTRFGIKVRSILSRETYFVLTILFAGSAVLLPPFRQNLFYLAFLACIGFLWIDFRVQRVSRRIKNLRQEVIQIRSMEAVKDFENARFEYQKLMAKYKDIPEFTQLILDCLRRIDSSDVLTITRNRSLKQEEIDAMLAASEEESASKDEKAARERDRRRHTRVGVEIKIAAVSHLDDPSIKGDVFVKDISQGGALIQCKFKFNPGDTLMLSSFALPDGTGFEDIFAKVVRVTEEEINQVAGLEFMYLEEDEKEKIGRYIKKMMEKGSGLQ